MRVYELLFEDYTQDMSQIISDIFAGKQASGISEMPMEELVAILAGQDINVAPEALLPLISTNEFVSTPPVGESGIIKFSSGENDDISISDPQQNSADTVERKAETSALDNIKSKQ